MTFPIIPPFPSYLGTTNLNKLLQQQQQQMAKNQQQPTTRMETSSDLRWKKKAYQPSTPNNYQNTTPKQS